MSNFYALMQDNNIQYIPLQNDIVDEIKNIFINAGRNLMPEGIEEDEFDGNIVARDRENITYVNYGDLPEDFNLIPHNQADMSIYNIERNEIPKSIFLFENQVYYFQVFNRSNLLQRKTVLKKEYGDKFNKITDNAFIVNNQVHAIYKDGKLYFKSYTRANQIFSLLEYVIEATREEIIQFGNQETLNVNADRMNEISNVKTRRLVKVLSQTSNISSFMSMRKRMQQKLLQDYNVKAHIDNDGKLFLPTDHVSELNRALEFLNEDIFKGAITKTMYRSNSKKKDL